MAKKIGARPSSLLSVSDEYASFCLDEVVFFFGSWVEGKIDEVEDKNEKVRRAKVENLIRKCIGLEQKFRSLG